VGKWKIVKFTANGIEFDLLNPDKTKKVLIKEIEKETGKEPTSSEVDAAFKELVQGVNKVVFEFTADGKSIIHAPDGDENHSETATYTVDYKKGELISEHKGEDNKIEKRTAMIKFTSGLLLMKFKKDPEVEMEEMTLKRIKN
jgi:hypothetical protein